MHTNTHTVTHTKTKADNIYIHTNRYKKMKTYIQTDIQTHTVNHTKTDSHICTNIDIHLQ